MIPPIHSEIVCEHCSPITRGAQVDVDSTSTSTTVVDLSNSPIYLSSFEEVITTVIRVRVVICFPRSTYGTKVLHDVYSI